MYTHDISNKSVSNNLVNIPQVLTEDVSAQALSSGGIVEVSHGRGCESHS